MDLQRKQLLNHNGNYSGQIAEHPTLRLWLRVPASHTMRQCRAETELASPHRACSWPTRIAHHETGWGARQGSVVSWLWGRPSQEGLDHASYTQARWLHPKLFGSIWKYPIMTQPNPAHTSYILGQLLTCTRLAGPSSSPTPRPTQKPHWDTVLGSKSRELPPSTCSIKVLVLTITKHCCHPTGLQTVKLRVHGCSSYWTL